MLEISLDDYCQARLLSQIRAQNIKYMYSLAVHGGAGSLDLSSLTAQTELLYLRGINDALDAGQSVLRNGGSALQAVQQAVRCLEDNPLFNAGKGSVFNSKGEHQMDAAVMCGKTLNAGAVAGVQLVKNPVLLAGKILESSDLVFLSGDGAREFASQSGIALENDSYFSTQEKYQQLLQAQKGALMPGQDTVGAVALDQFGNLAAASSTGGLTNKKYGRVGDSPVIGAGTYADDATCAVCCTGDGEYFIRLCTASDVSSMLRYAALSLKRACHIAIYDKLSPIGGEGGLIAVDRFGNIEMVTNCSTMPRGCISVDQKRFTAIYSCQV